MISKTHQVHPIKLDQETHSIKKQQQMFDYNKCFFLWWNSKKVSVSMLFQKVCLLGWKLSPLIIRRRGRAGVGGGGGVGTSLSWVEQNRNIH